jgi:hypothetical protein
MLRQPTHDSSTQPVTRIVFYYLIINLDCLNMTQNWQHKICTAGSVSSRKVVVFMSSAESSFDVATSETRSAYDDLYTF